MNADEKMLKELKARNKVYSLISLSKKAGYAASGEFLTEKTVKEGKAKLVIVAADASDNTKKMFGNMCTYYGVPCYHYGDKEKLGHSIGAEIRASLAITDEGMADALIKQLELVNEVM